jgi:hypothetical protein
MKEDNHPKFYEDDGTVVNPDLISNTNNDLAWL